jgi:hypothetical protein
VQTLAVGVLFAVLALTLPRDFFEDWGPVTGPIGWIAASLVTAGVVRLPLRTVAVAAAASGVVAALVGFFASHALSLPIAVALFAAVCAVRRRPALAAR